MAVSVAACVSVAFGGLLDRKGRDEEPEAMSIKQEPNGSMALSIGPSSIGADGYPTPKICEFEGNELYRAYR
jgi:hypothetical protein